MRVKINKYGMLLGINDINIRLIELIDTVEVESTKIYLLRLSVNGVLEISPCKLCNYYISCTCTSGKCLSMIRKLFPNFNPVNWHPAHLSQLFFMSNDIYEDKSIFINLMKRKFLNSLNENIHDKVN